MTVGRARGRYGLAGFIATLVMHKHGLYLSGMTNRVPWGLQISMAIFYIGLSAGSLVVSGLYGVFGKMEYKPFARIAAYLAMLFLIAGLLSIFTDQGRIDRVFTKPFTYVNPTSMFSINPALYSGHIMICVLYLWALFKEKGTLTKITSLVVVLWAIGTHTGTGAIFAFVPRELYNSALLPPSFVAAALSSGAALMILVIVGLSRATKRHLDDELIIWMGRRLLSIFIVVTFYVLLDRERPPGLSGLLPRSGDVLPIRGDSQPDVLVGADLCGVCGSGHPPLHQDGPGPPFVGPFLHRSWLWWGSSSSGSSS